MNRKAFVKELVEGLKEGQRSAKKIEAERFVRSLGAQGSELIDDELVPLPELNPDGSAKQKK